MTIDTNELRRLAQAATPGPWWVNRDGLNHGFARGVVEINANDWHALAGTWAVNGAKHSDEGVANAEFIAAANPAAISGLLNRLEAAEREADHQNALAGRALRVAERWKEKCKALRAKIEAMEQQEPTRDWWDCLIADISAIDCMYRGSPTYAHDAYWMRDHVVWMLKKRRDTLPGAQTKGEEE